MSNVVQLFKELTPEEAEAQIISNLKELHHCKPVNYFCTVNGINDYEAAQTALDGLIAKGTVRMQRYQFEDKIGRRNALSLYQYDILPAL